MDRERRGVQTGTAQFAQGDDLLGTGCAREQASVPNRRFEGQCLEVPEQAVIDWQGCPGIPLLADRMSQGFFLVMAWSASRRDPVAAKETYAGAGRNGASLAACLMIRSGGTSGCPASAKEDAVWTRKYMLLIL